jgi:probable rRNA maturation factor
MAFAVVFIESWPAELRDAVLQMVAAVQAQPDIILPEGTANLKLVDDTEIAALNEQYTGNAYATDVLTFNYQEGGSGGAGFAVAEGELADIAISFPAATRQAADAGTSVADEVALLVLHGLLHLLGYDHHSLAERRSVDALQRRILSEANLTYREFLWTE